MFISETCCNNVREAGMGLFIQAQHFAIAWSRQSGMNIEYIKTSVLIVCNAGTEVMITMLEFVEIIFHYCSDHSHIGRNSACNKARKIIKWIINFHNGYGLHIYNCMKSTFEGTVGAQLSVV